MKAKLILLLLLCNVISMMSQDIESVLLKNDIIEVYTVGIAFLGTAMTEADAKVFAIEDAKRKALEKTGTYLESHTEITNSKLTKDEIITYTGSILKAEIIEEKNEIINNRFAVKVKVNAKIDLKVLKERLSEIKENSKLKKQLKNHQEKIEKLQKKITLLQNENKNTTKEEVKSSVKKIAANEWIEKSFNTKSWKLRIEYLTEAIKLDPDNRDVYFLRGLSFFNYNNYQESIDDFTEAIKLNQDDGDSYSFRGLALNSLGRREEAIIDLSLAIKQKPNDAINYYVRGVSFKQVGRLKEAYADLTRAINLASKLESKTFYEETTKNAIWNMFYHRGIVLLCLNKNIEAIMDFNKAIKLNNSYSEAYFGRALTYGALQKHREAIEDFTRAISFNKKFADAYYGRAASYKALGEMEKCKNDIKIAFELDPNLANK